MPHKLVAMNAEFLYDIFLDIHKDYDVLGIREMYRNHQGVYRGAPGPPPTPPVLGTIHHGGKRKCLSNGDLQRIQVGHTGRPPSPYHFQRDI